MSPQISVNSLFFSLLAGNWARKVSARLLPLPFSLRFRGLELETSKNAAFHNTLCGSWSWRKGIR